MTITMSKSPKTVENTLHDKFNKVYFIISKCDFIYHKRKHYVTKHCLNFTREDILENSTLHRTHQSIITELNEGLKKRVENSPWYFSGTCISPIPRPLFSLWY